MWEIPPVTTIVKADKNRIPVRGVHDGAPYLVREEGNGWWIEPAPGSMPRVREVCNARKNLSEHLDALAAEGFEFSPAAKEKVPPCRF